MIIGICGKSGSGKSSLANKIKELNGEFKHLDIDKIGHEVLLLPEVKRELIKEFGEIIIIENQIDRKKLGQIVFTSKKQMAKLTSITWKYMQREIDKYLVNNNKVILDWILLPITKYFNMCNIKILLDVSTEIRKYRAIKRDSITEKEFELRDSASIDFNQFSFDYILQKFDEETIKRMVKLL